MIELLPRPVEDDLLDFEFDLGDDVECELAISDDAYCGEVAVCRVRIECRSCIERKEIIWICQMHLDQLKKGSIICKICHLRAPFWEIV